METSSNIKRIEALRIKKSKKKVEGILLQASKIKSDLEKEYASTDSSTRFPVIDQIVDKMFEVFGSENMVSENNLKAFTTQYNELARLDKITDADDPLYEVNITDANKDTRNKYSLAIGSYAEKYGNFGYNDKFHTAIRELDKDTSTLEKEYNEDAFFVTVNLSKNIIELENIYNTFQEMKLIINGVFNHALNKNIELSYYTNNKDLTKQVMKEAKILKNFNKILKLNGFNTVSDLITTIISEHYTYGVSYVFVKDEKIVLLDQSIICLIKKKTTITQKYLAYLQYVDVRREMWNEMMTNSADNTNISILSSSVLWGMHGSGSILPYDLTKLPYDLVQNKVWLELIPYENVHAIRKTNKNINNDNVNIPLNDLKDTIREIYKYDLILKNSKEAFYNGMYFVKIKSILESMKKLGGLGTAAVTTLMEDYKKELKSLYATVTNLRLTQPNSQSNMVGDNIMFSTLIENVAEIKYTSDKRETLLYERNVLASRVFKSLGAPIVGLEILDSKSGATSRSKDNINENQWINYLNANIELITPVITDIMKYAAKEIFTELELTTLEVLFTDKLYQTAEGRTRGLSMYTTGMSTNMSNIELNKLANIKGFIDTSVVDDSMINASKILTNSRIDTDAALAKYNATKTNKVVMDYLFEVKPEPKGNGKSIKESNKIKQRITGDNQHGGKTLNKDPVNP